MSLMQFFLAPHTLNFEAGADWPAGVTRKIYQVQDRTTAGTLQVETLGVQTKTRSLTFSLMKKTDYDALVNWFENVANGGEFVFQFTDEYGEVGNVRIIDDNLDFVETFLDTWAGSMNLEYV